MSDERMEFELAREIYNDLAHTGIKAAKVEPNGNFPCLVLTFGQERFKRHIRPKTLEHFSKAIMEMEALIWDKACQAAFNDAEEAHKQAIDEAKAFLGKSVDEALHENWDD